MTPKEKAEDLLSKYYFQVQTLAKQKQCALIAVDEIMKIGWNLPHYDNQEGYNYWYLVKTEIEKL